ncbi:maleylacetate reductase [Streptomyces sp. LUP47B]|uniref:maleylacetate reductase n=1 Tax=Streptomyces sp. LUP47B TaxID=1890286 RepID=UPI00085205B8|nr:maleylacetate reductase [Streptomyces sp. LUP47B]
MTGPFVHHTLGQRVRFATGDAAESLAAEVEAIGARRVMVVVGAHEVALAARITCDLPVVLVHHEVVMHVPVAVAERARAVAAEHEADLIVSVGGGSTTGLAKAVALTSGLPVVAVPTTYAGSEATDVWGLTEGTTKTTGSDARVLPRAVVYDAELTLSLPVELSVASGLNALAHCVDSMWAPAADPINVALATEGVRALADGLPRIVDDPTGMSGREQVLLGAYLSAVAFASAGSGLHHKICHVLGGRYGLPHAQTHAVVLPYVLALNGPFAPDADARLARAFGANTGLDGLQALRLLLRAPRSLRDVGLEEAQVADAAAAVMPNVPPSNPASVTIDNLTHLLHDAWEGADPR